MAPLNARGTPLKGRQCELTAPLNTRGAPHEGRQCDLTEPLNARGTPREAVSPGASTGPGTLESGQPGASRGCGCFLIPGVDASARGLPRSQPQEEARTLPELLEGRS